MEAYILCDASCDQDTLMATVAGYINFSGETVTFVKRLTEMSDSSSAELEAIFYSIKELNKLSGVLGIKVSSVQIGSDSLAALSNLNPAAFPEYGSGNERYQEAVERINSYLLFNDVDVTYLHVKAHQKIKVATPIEKLHNEVDRLARAELIQFRKDVFEPEMSSSRFYGVCLGHTVDVEDRDNYQRLGYQLAKQGYKARFHYEGVVHAYHEHPLYQGIARFAKESNDSIEDHLQIITWNNDLNESGVMHRAIGLDRLYVRQYYQNKHVNYRHLLGEIKYDKDKRCRGGAAARLMFGLQAEPPFEYEQPNSRLEAPSQFVFVDTHRHANGSVSSWLTRSTNNVSIPLYRSVMEINERLGLGAFKMTSNRFYGACLDRFPHLGDEQSYYRAGYNLAATGFIARLHNTSNELALWSQNPLYKGICAYASEQGLEPDCFIEYITWSESLVSKKDREQSVGLDRLLMDNFLRQEGLQKVWVDESSNSYRAGAATRLLMGYQQSNNEGELSLLREDNPSEFILVDTRMTRKNSVYSWLIRFKEMVDIPFYEGVNEMDAPVKIKLPDRTMSLLECA